MHKNLSFSVLLLLLTAIFSGCGDKVYETPESVINENAVFMNEEDLKGVMTTIHPESPAYIVTESMAQQIFERYDLDYKIENIKILEQNENEAKAEFTQVTRKINGPEFNNNKTTGIHTLRKDGDSWKIYSTEMVKVDLIDKDEFHN